MWNFHGSTAYLDRQAARLGISPAVAASARHNRETHRVGTLLAQASERYRQARKEDGRAVLSFVELAQVRGLLGEGERDCEKLHLAAAASRAMLDETYAAFGLEPPERIFGVTCAFDEPAPEPVPANGKVAAESSLASSAIPPEP